MPTFLALFCFFLSAPLLAGHSQREESSIRRLTAKRLPAQHLAEDKLDHLVRSLQGQTRKTRHLRRKWDVLFASPEAAVVLIDVFRRQGHRLHGVEEAIDKLGELIEEKIRLQLRGSRKGMRIVIDARWVDDHAIELAVHIPEKLPLIAVVPIEAPNLEFYRPGLAAYHAGREIVRHDLLGRLSEPYALSIWANVTSFMPQSLVHPHYTIENNLSLVRYLAVFMAGRVAAELLDMPIEELARRDEMQAEKLVIALSIPKRNGRVLSNEEAKQILDDAHYLARDLLGRRIFTLKPMVQALQDLGTITRHQLDLLYAGFEDVASHSVPASEAELPSNIRVVSEQESKNYPFLPLRCPNIFQN